jgi:hypothetical protein
MPPTIIDTVGIDELPPLEPLDPDEPDPLLEQAATPRASVPAATIVSARLDMDVPSVGLFGRA